jgi:hypothetical protein
MSNNNTRVATQRRPSKETYEASPRGSKQKATYDMTRPFLDGKVAIVQKCSRICLGVPLLPEHTVWGVTHCACESGRQKPRERQQILSRWLTGCRLASQTLSVASPNCPLLAVQLRVIVLYAVCTTAQRGYNGKKETGNLCKWRSLKRHVKFHGQSQMSHVRFYGQSVLTREIAHMTT